jgi:c(7)-type cytochrome triheme protein
MKIVTVVGICLALLLSSFAFAKVGGGDILFKVKYGNVTFSHDSHVQSAGLACQQCHDKPYLSVAQHKKVSMKEMEKGKSCGTCHDGKKAFSVKGDCSNCHKK